MLNERLVEPLAASPRAALPSAHSTSAKTILSRAAGGASPAMRPDGTNSNSGESGCHSHELSDEERDQRFERAVLEARGAIGRNVAWVIRRCWAHAHDDVVADLTQDVLLGILRRGPSLLDQWQSDRGLTLHGFFGLIARRHALSVLRGRKHERRVQRSTAAGHPDQTDRLDPERILIARETLRALTEYMRGLDGASRALFEASFIRERDVSATCMEFMVTRNALYCFKHRIRRDALHAIAHDE